LFYKSVAEDPEKVELDSRLPEVQSIEAFPETAELKLTNTQIHMIPYKHYDEKLEFHLNPMQQALWDCFLVVRAGPSRSGGSRAYRSRLHRDSTGAG